MRQALQQPHAQAQLPYRRVLSLPQWQQQQQLAQRRHDRQLLPLYVASSLISNCCFIAGSFWFGTVATLSALFLMVGIRGFVCLCVQRPGTAARSARGERPTERIGALMTMTARGVSMETRTHSVPLCSVCSYSIHIVLALSFSFLLFMFLFRFVRGWCSEGATTGALALSTL